MDLVLFSGPLNDVMCDQKESSDEFWNNEAVFIVMVCVCQFMESKKVAV